MQKKEKAILLDKGQKMKQYEVTIEGHIAPDGDVYTVKAKNKSDAKKKAMRRFKKDFSEEMFDWVEIEIKPIGSGK